MVAKVQNKKQSKGRQHHGKGVVSEQVLDEAVAAKQAESLQESEKALHTELADLRASTKKELDEANQKQGRVVKELRDRIAELEARKGPIAEKLEQLREVFAAIAHSEWAGWMKYMFSVGKLTEDETTEISPRVSGASTSTVPTSTLKPCGSSW